MEDILALACLLFSNKPRTKRRPSNLLDKQSRPARYRADRKTQACSSSGERSMLELGNLEEWRERSFDCALSFRCQLFEALAAEWAVLEFSSIPLLDKPFSTVPTLHGRCYTHFLHSPPHVLLGGQSCS